MSTAFVPSGGTEPPLGRGAVGSAAGEACDVGVRGDAGTGSGACKAVGESCTGGLGGLGFAQRLTSAIGGVAGTGR